MTLADALNPVLARLRTRIAQTPLPRFWQWWTGELLSFLPPRWRDALAVEESCVLLRARDADIEVLAERGGRRSALFTLPADARETWPELIERQLDDSRRGQRRLLLLPAARVLRRRLALPLAALENLPAVLGFELDRQTPFKAEQVYFDSRVLGAEPGARQAQVELSVVPRSVLDEQLQRLGALAPRLSGVDVEDADGRRLGINLLPADRRLALPRTWQLVQAGLLVAAVLLLFFAMGEVVENRREAVLQMQERVAAERERARAVSALRTQLDEAAAGANFLAVQKQNQPSMLVILHEVTRLLPDDTFLERLSLSSGQLSLTGYSSQATRLIGQLQDSALLRDPTLNGAIQPDGRTGRDRFTITASYGPAREEARR